MAEIEVQEVEIEAFACEGTVCSSPVTEPPLTSITSSAIPIQIKEEVYCEGEHPLSPASGASACRPVSAAKSDPLTLLLPLSGLSDEDSLNQDDDLDGEQMVALHPGEEFIGAEWSNDCDENEVSFPSSAPEVLIETS